MLSLKHPYDISISLGDRLIEGKFRQDCGRPRVARCRPKADIKSALRPRNFSSQFSSQQILPKMIFGNQRAALPLTEMRFKAASVWSNVRFDTLEIGGI
jgi:hypothetical protein